MQRRLTSTSSPYYAIPDQQIEVLLHVRATPFARALCRKYHSPNGTITSQCLSLMTKNSVFNRLLVTDLLGHTYSGYGQNLLKPWVYRVYFRSSNILLVYWMNGRNQEWIWQSLQKSVSSTYEQRLIIVRFGLWTNPMNLTKIKIRYVMTVVRDECRLFILEEILSMQTIDIEIQSHAFPCHKRGQAIQGIPFIWPTI